MQKVTMQKTMEYPWENPLLYSTKPHHFCFQEMGLYGIYGSPAWRHTGVLGEAMHHPDAALALMNMINKPANSVPHFTS